MALRVIGLRHGEVHNPGGVIYSALPGFVLSELGRTEAAAAAATLADRGVVAVYCSPLERAVETATAVADACGLEPRTDERLIEWKHWERWAGLTWDELRERGPEAWRAYTTDPGSVTAGESLKQLADRVEGWLTDVHDRHADGTVVAVSHLEPLRAVLLRLTGRPAADLFSIEIGHCGIVEIWPEAGAGL